MWWSKRFNLPPNHQLFLAETQTYWREWFLLETRRERNQLRELAQMAADEDATGQLAIEAHRERMDAYMGQLNALNATLGERDEELVYIDRKQAQQQDKQAVMEGASVADAMALMAKQKGDAGESDWRDKWQDLRRQMGPNLARE